MRHKPESAGTQSTGKTARGRETVRMAAVLLAAAAIALALLLKPAAPKTGSGDGETVQVLVDGEDWTGKPAGETAAEGLHVYITLNGEELITLPFGEAHTIRIIQPDGGENTVTMTGKAVSMTEANCPGHDCVQMGEVTAENLEVRVMGGFIICLPHRISVEVR